MNQREKLTWMLSLLMDPQNAFVPTTAADYLIEHGVVVLPCRCGDTVYEIIAWHDCTHPYCYNCGDEEEMSQKITCEYHKIRTTIVEREFKYAMIDEVGDSIFLTREEAERALAKRKGDNEL